jgi:hypothetical protein
VQGLSACDWKEGIRGYPPDSRESFLTAMWVAAPFVALLGMGAAGFRSSLLRS